MKVNTPGKKGMQKMSDSYSPVLSRKSFDGLLSIVIR